MEVSTEKHRLLTVYFKPTILKANESYIIRSPKYILPSHNHEYIKLTCRYQLPSLLNQYNANGNDAENNMDHISSLNPIKTVNTESLNNIKHYLSITIYNSTQISATSKNVIFVSTDTKRI